MVQCHVLTLSLLHIIVNTDNISGNVKAIAGKDKVTYTLDLSWIAMFLSWTLRWDIQVSYFSTLICCSRLTWHTQGDL